MIFPAPAIALILGLWAGPAAAQSEIRREDVEFQSGPIRLAGTLYLPSGPAIAPAVVLVHGSGPADRGTLRYYAELFAHNGVAALAYDKRGVGKSDGAPTAWRNFSLNDLAADAAAGVRFLRSRRDVDSTRVGLFGASQGGWVVPLAAQILGDVRFIITVSASLTTIAEDNLFERAARLRSEGFAEAEVEAARRMHELDIEVSRTGARFDEFAAAWETNRSAPWFRRVYGDDHPAAPDHPYRRWYRSVMDVDPIPIWRALRAPALFLFGDPALDRSSPVAASLKAVEGLRAACGDVEVRSFVGADHSLKQAGKDAPIVGPIVAWLRRIFEREVRLTAAGCPP